MKRFARKNRRWTQFSDFQRTTYNQQTGVRPLDRIQSRSCSREILSMTSRCSSISLLFYRTRVKSRYILSILVGLSLGFALSLACLPLINDCQNALLPISTSNPVETDSFLQNSNLSLFDRFDPLRFLNRQHRSTVDVTLVDYGSPDYEPFIRSTQDILQSSDVNKSFLMEKNSATTKVIRSRYIADELGIREKLLVAILTEPNHLNTYSIFMNQTLQEHVNKLIFFVGSEPQNLPQGIDIVSTSDKRVYLRPFYALKYLAEKFVKLYDWFFLVPDNTFIRGHKLREFVNHISINQDLYMGQAFDDVHAVYCYYGSGIILSGTVLQKILDELDWCTNNAYSEDLTDNIGRCILKAAKIACLNVASNMKFNGYVNYRFEFDSDIARLSQDENFNKTLTVHPINDLETMMKLQTYFNQVEINEMKKNIEEYEQMIEELSCFSVEGCGRISWPVGVPAPFKPTSRFDVLRWDYFNETHIYLKTDNDVVDPMNYDDYEDVHEVINEAVEQFKRKYKTDLKLKKLLNGYRQFDPTRGTHYIVDLLLVDPNNIEQTKRAELMRPLGLVELIPMPFVTETTFMYIIVPVLSDEQSAALRFLKDSNRTIFGKGNEENFELILVHVAQSKQEYSESEKWFEPIRRQVDSIREKQKSIRITYEKFLFRSTIELRSVLIVDLIEFFEEKLEIDSLIFVTTPFAQIESDFLNRCRLNVIEKVQVFFPIGFYQFHPTIIGQALNLTQNSNVELHKAHGWFNPFSFENVGLYLSDFLNLKNFLRSKNISIEGKNLFDEFSNFEKIHVFRSPDQSLRVHYRTVKCPHSIESNPIEFYRCSKQRERSLATRSQLAMFIIENQNEL